jgi:gamma-glutamyl hercynylcysteine S-oxide synthase
VTFGLDFMEAARARTWRFVQGLDEATLRRWPHPDFSPIGWHLGHVAFTEARWVLSRFGDDDALCGPFARAFAQDGRPKHERQDLPPRDALLGYLAQVREGVRALTPSLAPTDRLLRDRYLGWFLAAHEHQHLETMAFVLGQQRALEAAPLAQDDVPPLEDGGAAPRVRVPGGPVRLGHEGPLAYDNEQPAHVVAVGAYLLDAHPVTCGAFARFMRQGGYENPRWWSASGWRWREDEAITAPHGWVAVAPDRWVRGRLGGVRALDGREPVVGVSFHEAEAYARFIGARLPTEAEWERAARRFGAGSRTLVELATDGPVPVQRDGERPTDLLGHVWEWTASPFRPYPGFEAFPYHGYSTPYFGAGHRVLRGGSFATSALLATPSFRNWYPPATRPIFAGFRCAWDC